MHKAHNWWVTIGNISLFQTCSKVCSTRSITCVEICIILVIVLKCLPR